MYVNNYEHLNNQEPILNEEKASPIGKIVTVVAVIIIVVSVGILGYLKFKTTTGNKYTINKAAQFQVTYDSLPINLATEGIYLGSSPKPLPSCGNGTIYKSVEEALAVKDKKVCILALDYKDLKSLPSDISKFQDLEFIFLRGNSLTTFPSELLTLTHLRGIDISENQINDIPSSVNELKSLMIIVAKDNKIDLKSQQKVRNAVNISKVLIF